MNWENIAGQENLKKLLRESITENRVSHAQLFVGKEGYGTLPMVLAYAKEILSQENEHAASKVEHLNHLDLHFSFPVFTDNKNSLSKNKFEEFREMILASPYASYDDWTAFLESENKQLFISADEIDDQNQKFALKSFEGGTKILIVWRADKMNIAASNKFLKFLEEPPAKTIILLTAESTNDILPTILSRTQVVEVPRIHDEDLGIYLKKKFSVSEEKSREIIHEAQGNLNDAIKLLNSGDKSNEFEKLFVQWVRDAFMVKKKPEYLRSIIIWAREIAGWNREKQKNFLNYCSEIFRLALLQNYQSENLVYKKIDANGFNWAGFSKFISGANIENILEEINTADLHLTRNGNPKIVWTDLGIKLSRYIHKST
ncbi:MULTISPECIES: DNA polymerase III subunit [Chryseobacterium]|uniref:DNA polymerase III subunit delta n=1 Tax=Chryseobacterium pennae TaxID=2258962 RepID=A0A3D9C8R8_9FLAO|nr:MULTISPECIES: DNA polymerase III subunit delta' [Chryseobacterium]MCS4301273.1 DNA polymerase-3 subunit delta' [Chryseobacterium sp. BIGb0232]REC61901.1 DNA polymerase III subunit delta' [Chryseobacterium pennae]ROS19867.1 DNA polymerase-3 subunit delta' [Chryseobacterium nakagawai]